jgi:hypothetical protein
VSGVVYPVRFAGCRIRTTCWDEVYSALALFDSRLCEGVRWNWLRKQPATACSGGPEPPRGAFHSFRDPPYGDSDHDP